GARGIRYAARCRETRRGAATVPFFVSSDTPGGDLSGEIIETLCGLSVGGGTAARYVERAGSFRVAARTRRGILQHRSAGDRKIDQAVGACHRGGGICAVARASL